MTTIEASQLALWLIAGVLLWHLRRENRRLTADVDRLTTDLANEMRCHEDAVGCCVNLTDELDEERARVNQLLEERRAWRGEMAVLELRRMN